MIPLPKKAWSTKGKIKGLKQITTVSGKAYMNMEPDIRKMSRELSRLLEKAQPLEAECAKICKEMSGHMESIQTCLERLNYVTSNLNSCYKSAADKFSFTDFHDMSEIYLTLNETFSEWNEIWKKEQDNFFRNIRMLFTFSNYEEQGLEEVSFYIN